MGCHFLLRDLPDLGIESMSAAAPALAGRFFTTEPPGRPALPASQSIYMKHSELVTKEAQKPPWYDSLRAVSSCRHSLGVEIFLAGSVNSLKHAEFLT